MFIRKFQGYTVVDSRQEDQEKELFDYSNIEINKNNLLELIKSKDKIYDKNGNVISK